MDFIYNNLQESIVAFKSEKFEKILALIQSGSMTSYLSEMSKLNEQSLYLNYVKDDGRTLLLQAIVYDQTQLAKDLLNRGANPNMGHFSSYDCLYYAVQNKNSELSKLLIEYGANTEKNYENQGTIEEIIERSDDVAIKEAIDKIHEDDDKVELEEFDDDEDEGFIELDKVDEVIAEMPDTRIIEEPIAEDFDLVSATTHWENVTKSIEQGGGDHTVDQLFTFIPKREISEDDYRKYMDMVDGYRNKKGQNALMLACKVGNLDFIKKLVANGSDVNSLDHAGNSPLFYALSNGDYGVIDFLVDRSANVRQKNMKEQSLLFLAMKKDNIKAFTLFIKKGASTIHKIDGSPLITIAVKEKMHRYVQLFVDFGADLKATDKKYLRAMDHAVRLNDKESIAILKYAEEAKEAKAS